MNEPITLGLKHSKFNLELSKTETMLCFKSYFETELLECVNDFCLYQVKGTPKQILNCLQRLALTKEAHIFSKTQKLKDLAKLFDLKQGPNTTFKVEIIKPENKQKRLELINKEANKILESKFSEKISLTKPDLTISVFKNQTGLLIWTNKDTTNTRKAHLKPAPHPSGIDPRLAKAMINLAGTKQEALDPFCGAGGILEEIKLMNLKYIGTDISWKMINLARINLKSKDNLYCKDAFTWNKNVECIVTDLPYGKNTKLDGELTNLINKFFEHFKDLTNKIVVCCPNKYDLETPAKKNNWNLIFHTDIYIHGSLTRRIHVFEKKQKQKTL